MNQQYPHQQNNSLNTFPNGPYPPYGYNDNNFNRQRFPSNIYPPNGGNRGNPFGRYNPLSTNQKKLIDTIPSMSNFQKAYQQPNHPVIETINYANQNKLLHNNISENVLDEHIVEYYIDIDSLDRDIGAYPNPFNFIVKFNPPSGSRVRTERIKHGVLKPVNDFLQGPPKPHINKEFKNVKYIKLDTIVLPQFSNIIENNEEEGSYKYDPDSLLITDRFVSLVIDELDCNRRFSTGDGGCRLDDDGKPIHPDRQFAIILPDKLLGLSSYVGTPYNGGSKIFKNSLLGNIKTLTVSFQDSCGKKLKFDNLYTERELCDAEAKGTPIPLTDIRHPLNKKNQVFVSLVFGVVESQINTNTKFEC